MFQEQFIKINSSGVSDTRGKVRNQLSMFFFQSYFHLYYAIYKFFSAPIEILLIIYKEKSSNFNSNVSVVAGLQIWPYHEPHFPSFMSLYSPSNTDVSWSCKHRICLKRWWFHPKQAFMRVVNFCLLGFSLWRYLISHIRNLAVLLERDNRWTMCKGYMEKRKEIEAQTLEHPAPAFM